MKDRIVLVIIALVLSARIFAQGGIIRGNVYDKSTGEPIVYCNLFLKNTTKGTNSDLNGFYTLSNIDAGEYILVATYLGYDTIQTEVKVSNRGIISKNIYLNENAINLGTVNISARREEARTEVRVSTVKVSPKQIKALPSVGGEPDIAQYLQVLPGIVSTGDQGGQLYIRGGSPVQNKILLDGFPIYNPFHSIGFFSVFETELIKNVDVLTGGFNAEYGGRISAVVDINTRTGNKVRHGGFVSASPFVAKALIEGPISKFNESGGSSSFVFSAKQSLIHETSKTLYDYTTPEDVEGLPFEFQDLYGKLSVNGNNGSKLDLFGFKFKDIYNNPSLANIQWDNVGVGANFKLIPAGSDLIMGGSVGFTNYDLGFVQTLEDPRNSSIRELGITLDFSFFGDNSEIKYGVDLRSIRTDFEFTNPFGQYFQQAQNTTELAGFFRMKQIFGNLIIEPSLRLMYYASQSQFSPEPRLGLKYNISDKLRFKFAGGLYSQNLLSTQNERDIVNLFSGFLTGPEEQVLDINDGFIENKLQKSRHLVAGFEYNLTDNIELNIEGYLKDYPQLITINRNKLLDTDPDYVKEEGKAYGVDFSLRYELPRLYVWLTYSHSYVNRFDGDQEYPTVFDRRHNANALFTYSLDAADTWQVSARWNLGSGFPFTKSQGFYNAQNPEDGVNTQYETNNPDELGILYSTERNGGRLPYYHRLDLSVSKKIKFSKHTGVDIVASVTNAYDRANIFYFDRVLNERVDQLPIIPSLAAKFSF